jgi:hypothetical protein
MSDGREKTLIEQLENELGVHAGTALAEEVRLYLTRLNETNDVNWIDLIVVRLTEEGVPLPTAIQDLAAGAAERRLHGAGKNPTKVMKEFTERVAHSNAAFLQGALGLGAEEAYNISATAVGAETGYAGKASVVSRGRQKYAAEGPAAGALTKIGGTVRNFVCGRAVEHYAAMARMKRSPNMTANWALAIDHSRGGIFHSFSDRFKIR